MLATTPNIAGRISDSHAAWSDLPTDFLRAELDRRQSSKPACGSAGSREKYNTPLHVIALIIILVLSTVACSFPIIVRHFPRLPVPHHFLFLSRHFGTGVLIATAFVHLLPTAFVSLTDPCLPSFWNRGYPAMAGLIAMTSVLLVVGIEMFFATRGAGHMHGSEYDTLPENERHGRHKNMSNGHTRPRHTREESPPQYPHTKPEADDQQRDIALGTFSGSSEQLINATTPSTPSTPVDLPNGPQAKHNDLEEADPESDLDLDELDPTADVSNLLPSYPATEHQPLYRPSHPNLSTQQLEQKQLLQCLLLEAGILFHSIFIGMALSVATGTSFLVLLIAISFHQTFEGLALGSRIAAITSFPRASLKPWLMALAYGTTTPVGQAIGLAVHGLYDPAGKTGLLMVGVMNAISSGLLLFAGLVELLAEDFLSDRSYEVLKGRRRMEACGAVVAGALLMALVGAWA